MISDSDVGWGPDFLHGYERLTLHLAPDDEGDVVATLVRPMLRPPEDAGPAAERAPGGRRTESLAERFARFWRDLSAVQGPPGVTGPTSGGGSADGTGGVPDAGVDLLYLHGWQDYFFQTHLAEYWEGLGVRFHALDLRKYGRSLHQHQTPGYVTDLATYDEDIEAALAAIGHGLGPSASATETTSGRRLILMGHSTGGLTLSLWAARNPGRAAGLVLNSPWLEFQTRQVGRRVLEPGIGAQAAIAPRSQVLFLDRGFYVRSISSRLDGEWDLDVPWRSDEAPWKPTSGWLAAIFRGHQQVARGLGLNLPVLVLLSARSTAPLRWSDDMVRTDTVLDVVGIARRATDLGNLCTLVRVEGALHDVTLSAPPVREVVWRETTRWFRCYVGSATVAPHAAG
ncbi:alpha/beta hydrolase [Antribacter sp. KLBMP9083]|uniref:Alpha/beta hydrolase n=1 Tax=Antribacter soli TaxID=2910976 RepID=A0AA41U5X6_9MICO|nr:alpha/beta hydrolase [Antribacter soli]MCF4120478.1 alpha/beta hydrolase [Antribacter soli]